ncbi:MAG: FixH family protein [Nannocystaceae bacterium]
MKAHGRSPWPWGIGIGLGIVVLANAIMIHLAVSNPSVPASADHYGESLRWDEVQAERTRAQQLGWQVRLQPCELRPQLVDAAGPRGCALRLSVRDAQGAPVRGLSGEVTAQRSDDATLDREVAVREAEAGEYQGTLALAQPGLYTFAIRLEGGPAPWVDERRLEVVGVGTP